MTLGRERGARVAVIGGGWSGMAAAVRLTRDGFRCTVFEAARTAGGRARRVVWQTAAGESIEIDNGQHILIGAYRRTLALLDELGVDLDAAFERTPLSLVSTSGFSLEATRHSAPWHLFWGLLRAKGISIDERWAIVQFMRTAQKAAWTLPEDCTVAALLLAWKQPATLVHKFWSPLCIAALNTDDTIASAQVFLHVLRDSLGADARDSDLLLPRTDLGGLLPDAAAAAVDELRLGVRIQNLLVDDAGVEVASGSATGLGQTEHFDAAVLAVPASEAARLLAPMALRDLRYRPLVDTLGAFEYQPIVTAYLLYREAPRWTRRMRALEPAPHLDYYAQWAFDRSDRLDRLSARPINAPQGLIAAVISADGAHRDFEQAALADLIAAQLASQCGLPRRPVEYRMITEKRATFASVPGLRRPSDVTPHQRLVLCGDFARLANEDTDYPATLEIAVATGQAAATTLAASLRR